MTVRFIQLKQDSVDLYGPLQLDGEIGNQDLQYIQYCKGSSDFPLILLLTKSSTGKIHDWLTRYQVAERQLDPQPVQEFRRSSANTDFVVGCDARSHTANTALPINDPCEVSKVNRGEVADISACLEAPQMAVILASGNRINAAIAFKSSTMSKLTRIFRSICHMSIVPALEVSNNSIRWKSGIRLPMAYSPTWQLRSLAN